MAHWIDSDECDNCGLCERSCVLEAISLNEEETKRWIDPEICNDCGDCIDVCPLGAIYEEPPS